MTDNRQQTTDKPMALPLAAHAGSLNNLWREDDIERVVFLSMWEDIPSGPVEVLTFRELSRPSLPLGYTQSARRPQFSYARGSESCTRKIRLHYGDFVQVNSTMADKTAGQLRSTLRVNKASAKAFEPRTT